MIISAAAVPIAFASSSSIAFDSQKGFQRAGGLPLFLHVLQRPKVPEWIGINSIISTSTTPSWSASPPCPSQLLNRTLIFTFIIIVVVVKDDFVLDAVTVAVLHSRWYPSCEELLVVASCCCSGLPDSWQALAFSQQPTSSSSQERPRGVGFLSTPNLHQTSARRRRKRQPGPTDGA